MIHFVGAGPGAEDLITVRGQRYLEQADVVIYAGSLVNPGLLKSTKETCEIYNSAKMTLEEVLDVIFAAEEKGRTTVRLHTGDPSLYGAIREQMDVLEKLVRKQRIPQTIRNGAVHSYRYVIAGMLLNHPLCRALGASANND